MLTLVIINFIVIASIFIQIEYLKPKLIYNNTNFKNENFWIIDFFLFLETKLYKDQSWSEKSTLFE